MKKIAIQGEQGSFHHAAALSWYGDAIELIPCFTFKDVFKALQISNADGAVVAIENSLHGSINEVYDLLLANNLPIIGEVTERIHQCLIGYSGTHLQDITAVYSHPVALSQCSDFLETKLPNADRRESHDTAGSVQYIKKKHNKHHAAIASKLAARLHGMTILQNDIQNRDTNYTRFLIIETAASTNGKANKASLVIETDHQPGALYKALGVLERQHVNMTKLQSRPIQGKLWRYMFYLDIEAQYPAVEAIVHDLHATGCKVTMLGHYPKATSDVHA